jgi:hypothetical protein
VYDTYAPNAVDEDRLLALMARALIRLKNVNVWHYGSYYAERMSTSFSDEGAWHLEIKNCPTKGSE